jgi:hypothetical protein
LMSRLLYPFHGFTRTRRPLLPSIPTLIVLAGLALALPQCAAAEATPGPEPTAGPSGLPDGRIYEQVSPQNKPGSEAGGPIEATPPYIAAGVGGNEVAYFKSGPLGKTPTGFDFFSIARRFSTGWQSRGAVSRGAGFQRAFFTNPQSGLGFSMDMTASVFGAEDVFVPEQELRGPTPHLYRYDEDGTVQWIGKPTIPDPVVYEGGRLGNGSLAGGASLDYNTIYFGFEGALTPADDESNPVLGGISRAQEIRIHNESGSPLGSNDGFFVWHDGVLESAGVLPDGRLDPFGAVPAATGTPEPLSEERLWNQVSEDGREAFFLSPDPEAQSGRSSQLYVRKTLEDGSHTTALVSRDLLLAEVGGFPASAPDGGTFLYASSDGSRVFFSSIDQLTSSAPNDAKAKTYEFDTVTESLTYLSGLDDLTGPAGLNTFILRMSRDGSNFLFVDGKELEFWNEGVITDISPFENSFSVVPFPTITRSTPSGSVYVLQVSASFPKFGFKNGNGEYEEVYRYETSTNKLSCVSCPPTGVPASGNAELSHAFRSGALGNTFSIITGSHGISEDGNRIFFDTPDGLVSQDSNGVRDAYEWQDGTIYLISSGVNQRPSFAGDTSQTGDDLFFSTIEGIAPGDKDESYDVYDARVPRPGDQPPPSAVPCEGAVCQGPPSVPQLLSPPASAAFDGPGDATPAPPGHSAPKSLTRQQKLARALKACQKNRSKSKRARCKQQARHRYAATAAGAQRKGNDSRHHNGRGK